MHFLPGDQVQLRAADSGEVEFAVYRVATGHVVVAPRIATFAIDHRGAVTTQTDGVPDSVVDTYFRYRIAPLLGQLEGKPCLHGGAVVANETAVAFLGNSGAGKSTLVASLSDRYPVLGDDCVRVERSGDSFVAHPADACLRLWDDSRARLAPNQPWSDSFGKAGIDVERAQHPARLARIYLLEAADTVSVDRLGRRDALARLAGHAYRLDPSNARLLEQEIAFFEAIATRVVVARLTYPRSFDALPKVHAAIFEDLRTA